MSLPNSALLMQLGRDTYCLQLLTDSSSRRSERSPTYYLLPIILEDKSLFALPMISVISLRDGVVPEPIIDGSIH